MEVSDQSVSESGEVKGGGDLVQEAYIDLADRARAATRTYTLKQSIQRNL